MCKRKNISEATTKNVLIWNYNEPDSQISDFIDTPQKSIDQSNVQFLIHSKRVLKKKIFGMFSQNDMVVVIDFFHGSTAYRKLDLFFIIFFYHKVP